MTAAAPSAPDRQPRRGPAPVGRVAGAAAGAALAVVVLAGILISAAGGSIWLWLAQLPRDVLLAGGWLAAAWGWGWLVLALVARSAGVRTSLEPLTLPMGAALLLTLDGAGLRMNAGPAVVWGLQLVGTAGALAAAAEWRRRLGTAPLADDDPVATAEPPAGRLAGMATILGLGLASVAAAVLLAAASSPPGWLWASEFDGYDVLSYHLQLPLEWMAAGRSTPLPHNAYAWMPNGLEHVSLHLGGLAGDVRAAATAAQMLHAALAVAATMTAGGLVRDLGGRRAAAAATAALVVGTPWVVVTGSLAYTEMMVLWMLAASMRLTVGGAVRDAAGERSLGLEGVVHGGLLAAACAAKLTAGPLAVIPAAVWWFAVRGWPGPRRMAAIAASATIAGALTLAPWWVSNLVHAGNPVFPFATAAFGPGPWTDAQVAAWNAGHRAGGHPADIWSQWLDPLGVPGHRSPVATAGDGDGDVDGVRGADSVAPAAPLTGADGARTAQWALLPWIGLLGLVALLARAFAPARATVASTAEHESPAVDPRRVAIGAGAALAFQLLAWLSLTHAEARFLLPTVIPASIAGGLLLGRAADAADRGRAPGPARAVVVAGLLAIAAGPASTVRLWFAQRGGDAAAAVGQADVLAGAAHDEAIRAARAAGDRGLERELLDSTPPSWWINHALPDARVLLIGEAAPFWLATDRIAYRTVWDRDALSHWLDAADAGADPRPWTARALADGFTHVLVDQPMLENWSRRGWNDPRITWESLIARTDPGALVPRRTFASRGQTLYRLVTVPKAD